MDDGFVAPEYPFTNFSTLELHIMTYLALSVGNFWNYILIPSMSFEKDSVESVFNLPIYGTCADISGKMAKLSIIRDTTTDSTFIWYGNGYFYKDMYRFAKENPYLGETWEAWNDCVIPLNTRIPFVDFDMDSIVDTVIYRPSNASVVSLNDTVSSITGNIKVVSRLNYIIILTSSLSPDSISTVEVRSFYYKPYFGITKEFWDSTYQTIYRGIFSYDISYYVGIGKEINLTEVREFVERKHLKIKEIYDISGRRTNRNFRIRKGNVGIR